MDPFLVLEVTNPWEKAVNSAAQRSTCKDNNEDPVWEEEFSFLIDTNDSPGQLKITLWDANYIVPDVPLSSPAVLELSELEKAACHSCENSIIAHDSMTLILSVYRAMVYLIFLCV